MLIFLYLFCEMFVEGLLYSDVRCLFQVLLCFNFPLLDILNHTLPVAVIDQQWKQQFCFHRNWENCPFAQYSLEMPITKNIFLHNILFSSLVYGLFTMLYHKYLPHFVSTAAQVFTSSQPSSQLEVTIVIFLQYSSL